MNSQSKKMELLGSTSIPKALLAMGIPTMVFQILTSVSISLINNAENDIVLLEC